MTALGTAQVIQGNALHLPLEDATVDLICTSPPYFGLRSYQDNGGHYDGQIGSEATPAEFLDALIAATREMVRVLKPSGSIFVNLGDKYAGPNNPRNGRSTSALGNSENWKATLQTGYRPLSADVPNKSLMGIPWRYAIACIDQLGLILRAEIIWAKPNGLPESVTDRVRRSHEQWFHFTKQPRYFAAVDEIREEHLNTSWASAKRARGEREEQGPQYAQRDAADLGRVRGNLHPLGKLPGSVWSIPTQPLTVPPELGVDHFAAYPMEWPRRIIQGWTPSGICTVCGEGRRPVSVSENVVRANRSAQSQAFAATGSEQGRGKFTVDVQWMGERSVTIASYACACEAHLFAEDTIRPRLCRDCYPEPVSESTHGVRLPPTDPAVVLDPFGGTGTTALVAKALGRTGITIDRSADYCRLAEWRCNDPRELAAALQVEKPEAVPADQLSLFGDLA